MTIVLPLMFAALPHCLGLISTAAMVGAIVDATAGMENPFND